MDIKYLDKISGPEDIKELNKKQLNELAEEIREKMIDTVSHTGGHLASNLGVVELTIAMHKCFNSPYDHFIWDVGHQVYTHKLLTGRYSKFDTLRTSGGISGFPNPEESKHDVFAAGHSGTSISAAYGLSVADTLNNKKSYTVAVIGDGSFTGGLVYEALNNAGRSNTNLIVVLNDNEMSISPNVGAIAKYLAAIRTKPVYYNFKEDVQNFLDAIPVVGEQMTLTARKIKRALKDRMYNSTFFEDMGFSYMGPIDGHDITALCKAFESAKSFDTPVLLHINTKKGKGYDFAEMNPSTFHGISKFDIDTGETKSSGTNYSEEFGKYLCKYAEENKDICAITAAMALGTGLKTFAKRFPERFFDVGIAEEFAVTYAGGLAAGGKIPVFAVYSTFLQRAYDEMVHDVAMQNQKVILAVDRAGLVGEDGRSHQGILDIAFLRSIPGTTIYSPSSYAEVGIALKKAIDEDGKVVAIRYPRGKEGYLPKDFVPNDQDYKIYGRIRTTKNPTPIIVTFGALFSQAIKAQEILKEKGVDVVVLKLNRIWPIPEEAIKKLQNAKNVFFFEEGIKSGGVGEAFAAKLLSNGFKGKYEHIAIENTFVHHAKVAELLDELLLSADKMVEKILEKK